MRSVLKWQSYAQDVLSTSLQATVHGNGYGNGNGHGNGQGLRVLTYPRKTTSMGMERSSKIEEEE